MSVFRKHRSRIQAIALAAMTSALVLRAEPASGSAAVFLPKGSTARVDKHHATVALTASGAVAWNAIDVSNASGDVGVLVAVKAGGKVEVTARVFIDVVEGAASVKVSAIPPSDCKTGGSSGSSGVSFEGGFSGRGDLQSSSGGCQGGSCESKTHADGGGNAGCWSNNSAPSGGCGSCDGCEPTEEGHPGCSAFATQTGCGPLDNGSSGSSGSSSSSGSGGTVVGPYELFKVRAADGSARKWLDDNKYEAGTSFDAAIAAVEKDGYELYAVRARPPTSASVVQSLRVITTSPSPSFPLRMIRLGASGRGGSTPFTLVTLGSTAQQLRSTPLLRVDPSQINRTNYESLVTALLGGPTSAGAPVDAGADAGDPDAGDAGPVDAGPPVGPEPNVTRWVAECSLSVQNRITRSFEGGASSSSSSSSSSASSSGGSSGDPPSEPETLADLFRSQCGQKQASKHGVCGPDSDGGDDDAGVVDSGTTDAGDASTDAGTADAAVSDAGASDAGEEAGDASTTFPGCSEQNRTTCDDIDLALPSNGSGVATRFRAVISGDPATINDLVFETNTAAAYLDCRLYVRNDGQPGLCDPPPGSQGGSAKVDEDASCRQTPVRPWMNINFGPIVMLLVVARILVAIMKRARR